MCVMFLQLSLYSEQSQGNAKNIFDLFGGGGTITRQIKSAFSRPGLTFVKPCHLPKLREFSHYSFLFFYSNYREYLKKDLNF